MSGRLSLLLVFLFLFGLGAWLGRSTTHRSEEPAARPVVVADKVPIVAVRGRPLAPYEEPLPVGARVRIGSTRYRHPNSLRGQEATAVERYVVTLPNDAGTFTLTDTVTGQRVAIQTVDFGDGPASSVSCVASGDGSRLAVWQAFPSTRSVVARVWRVKPDPKRPLTALATIHLPKDVTQYLDEAVFTNDGRELVIATHNSVLRYDATTGGLTSVLPSDEGIVCLSADGSRFLAADDPDPRFPVAFFGGPGRWVIPTYRFRTPAGGAGRAPTKDIYGFSAPRPEIQQLVLTVGDARSGGRVVRFTIPRAVGESVPYLCLARDGRHLSYGFRGELFVVAIDQQRQVLRLPSVAGVTPWPDSAGFTADGRQFVVGAPNGPERVFDLDTGRDVPSRTSDLDVCDFLGRPVRPDLVTNLGAIARRDPENRLPGGYTGVVIDTAPAGDLIAVGDATGRLDVWRPDGRRVTTLCAGGKGITALRFSPDGSRLAACDRSRIVRVWSVGAWRERTRIEVPADSDELCPDCLAFSPDGRRLLVNQQDVMALWDFASRQWVWDREGCLQRHRLCPSFSPDGSHILTSWDSWVDARTGDEIRARRPEADRPHRWQGRGPRARRGSQVSTTSDDGTLFAGRGEAGGLCVWSVGSGELVRAFPESREFEHFDSVLRFSPDGRRLVTCDDAGHAHVWEVASGQLAFTLTYPDGAVHDVRFGADGRSLVTSNHREVIVWDLTPEPGAAADPWAALAAEAPTAEHARRALLADPVAAVELLKRQLWPAAPVDSAAVARLVAQLDAADYRERARAEAEVHVIGRRILPLLRALTAHSEEGKARLAAIVHELSAGPTAFELREARAVEVLEQIATPAARAVLAELAAGDAGSVLTEEARAGRRRFAGRRLVP